MTLQEVLQNKINQKTKPLGSLGKLEEIALQVGSILNSDTPELINPHMLVFAADHGLTAEGVSPYPKEVTAQMVLNFLRGGAAINVFSRQHNINLKVVDAGVDFDFEANDNLVDAKFMKGTRNMIQEPAMTLEECRKAMSKGAELINEVAQTGCNIIGFGEMGIGNTSAGALLMHKYSKQELSVCTGRGTGHDDEGLDKKIRILQQVADKHTNVNDAEEILATFGGLEIAMMAGAMLRAAKNNMIVLIDGFIATSALLAASEMDKSVLKNCIFCHVSDEQGHKFMLDYLQAKPLLNLGLRLGEGTGAAVAFPLVQSAVNFLNEMASFESASVSNKE